LALSSACVNASFVPMSGFAAPLRMATPIPECAIDARVLWIFALATRPSMIGVVRMATSKAVP
jgi:hypothetical protein